MVPDRQTSPREANFYFPAEWVPHQATWLSFPHNLQTWPGGLLSSVQDIYVQWINALSDFEEVHILVQNEAIVQHLQKRVQYKPSHVFFHICPSNDAWIRDYGPGFLLHRSEPSSKALLNWQFNSWGEKYLPYDDDNACPDYIAQFRGVRQFKSPYVLEGGSIEVNGAGTLLTTAACLLHPRRNPGLAKAEIEALLMSHYSVEQVIWLRGELAGDDTDGHIDNLARFVTASTVLVGTCQDVKDPNYEGLAQNLIALRQAQDIQGKPFRVLEMPMPAPLYLQGQRLPASYLNFYVANHLVVLPQYRCPEDEIAREILQTCFPNHKILGLDARAIIWGGGSFHCLSQQEPACPKNGTSLTTKM